VAKQGQDRQGANNNPGYRLLHHHILSAKCGSKQSVSSIWVFFTVFHALPLNYCPDFDFDDNLQPQPAPTGSYPYKLPAIDEKSVNRMLHLIALAVAGMPD
jgi:hypothetical protein